MLLGLATTRRRFDPLDHGPTTLRHLFKTASQTRRRLSLVSEAVRSHPFGPWVLPEEVCHLLLVHLELDQAYAFGSWRSSTVVASSRPEIDLDRNIQREASFVVAGSMPAAVVVVARAFDVAAAVAVGCCLGVGEQAVAGGIGQVRMIACGCRQTGLSCSHLQHLSRHPKTTTTADRRTTSTRRRDRRSTSEAMHVVELSWRRLFEVRRHS